MPKPSSLKWDFYSDYDFVDELDGDAIAWEFLRRNESYLSDFQQRDALYSETAPETKNQILRGEFFNTFGHFQEKWRIFEAVDPKADELPEFLDDPPWPLLLEMSDRPDQEANPFIEDLLLNPNRERNDPMYTYPIWLLPNDFFNDKVVVCFDLNKKAEDQLRSANKLLMDAKEYFEKQASRTLNIENIKRCLRLLDARSIGLSNKQIVSNSHFLAPYPDTDEKHVADWYQQAKKHTGNYLSLRRAKIK